MNDGERIPGKLSTMFHYVMLMSRKYIKSNKRKLYARFFSHLSLYILIFFDDVILHVWLSLLLVHLSGTTNFSHQYHVNFHFSLTHSLSPSSYFFFLNINTPHKCQDLFFFCCCCNVYHSTRRKKGNKTTATADQDNNKNNININNSRENSRSEKIQC